MRKISLLSAIDQIGRAQTIWAILGTGVIAVWGYLDGFPPSLIAYMGVGTFAFLLIIFHRLNLWWSQRIIAKPERFEELGHALNALRDATLAAPVIDWKAASGSDFERASAHMDTFRPAYEAARRAIAILEYDRDTWTIANDYRHLCSMIFTDAQMGDSSNENRGLLYAMHAPIMRRLSNGRRIDRKKIPRPDWMKEIG